LLSLEKRPARRERVRAELPRIVLREAPAATDGELALAHTPGYIDDVTAGHVSDAAMRAIGFPWSPAIVERARRSVGATVCAARQACATEWRAPG
jgi:acetoin utilization deacetylase AcuC-like enzyme